jgi:GNAT superfamily N-acetyltransferase
MPASGVRLLAEHEIDAAAELLARAFHDDPVTCYSMPDSNRRAAVLPRALRPGVWLAHHLGEVWCTDDMSAVACWRRPGARHASSAQFELAGVPEADELLGSEHRSRSGPVEAHLAARAEALGVPAAHWYLSMVGVAPQRRRQGLGSAVLRPVLDAAKARREPAYLETFGPDNVAFYVAQGFSLVEADTDPGSSLPYWLFLLGNDAT